MNDNGILAYQLKRIADALELIASGIPSLSDEDVERLIQESNNG